MRNPVWNPEERRLRAVVRLLGQLVLFAVAAIIFSVVGTVIAVSAGVVDAQQLQAPMSELELGLSALSTAIATAATVVSVALAAWWLDWRRLRDLGLALDRWWWRDFLAGLVLGAAMVSAVVAVLIVAGWVEVTDTLVAPAGTHPAALVGLVLVVVLGVGVSEELLIRGYQLTNIAEGLGDRLGHRAGLLVAVLVTAVIFGVLHSANPNSGVLSTVNLIVVGVFLGLGYALTGRLALPIGVHVTWNLFLGPVFGFPVSGWTGLSSASLVATEPVGPELLTGGAFGPEGGLLALAASLLGIVAVVAWARLTRGSLQLAASIAVPPTDQSSTRQGPP